MQEKSTQIKSSFAFEKEQVPGEDDYDFNWEIRLILMKLGQHRVGQLLIMNIRVDNCSRT